MSGAAHWRDLSPLFLRTLDTQGGVATSDQAYAAGHLPADLQALRRAQVLTSVRRGVYALTTALDSLTPAERHRLEARAALLVLRPPAVLGHETAAVWHGLELLRPDLGKVHIVRADRRAARLEAGLMHHAAELPAGHTTMVHGVAVTAPARTGIDIARTVDLARGVAVIDSVLRSGLPRGDLVPVMENCRSWPGARRASRALSLADERAANPGESWSRVLLVSAGLPPDDLQVPLYDEAGLIGVVDFYFRRARLVGEFDGRLKYAIPGSATRSQAADVLWAEKRREDRIRATGHRVVRWTWNDLFNPDQFLRRLRRAMEEGRSSQARGA